MKMALDYDDTYTRDPLFWNGVILYAQERGHEVWCVSARHPSNMGEVELTVGRLIGRDKCVGTDGVAKADFMWDAYEQVFSVWIDDKPEAVVTDTNKSHFPHFYPDN